MPKPDEFADRLCARLIQQGILLDGTEAHRTLHAAAREVYSEVATERPGDVADPIAARYVAPKL